MAAIEVEGLEKTYPKGVRALDGVSFSVAEGEVFGLLGPNGAGKSTTVKILATLSTLDAGTARVAGYDVVREAGAVRRSIGYVPQASGVDVHATGRENILLQGRVQRVPPAELRRRMDDLLETFGLGDFADRIVRTYSGGMKRRRDRRFAGGDAAAAAAVVERLGVVEETVTDGRHLRARVEHGAQAAPGILSALEASGIAVASVTVARPVDDVYLHFTRNFRSEDEAGSAR